MSKLRAYFFLSLILSAMTSNANHVLWYNPIAVHNFSCADAASAVRGIRRPLGLTDEQFPEVVRRIRIVREWDKFEAVILGGSRTHFTFGVPPKLSEPEDPESVTSDLDVQIFPSVEWRASPSFMREWYPANHEVQYAILYGGPMIVRPVEMIQQIDTILTLSHAVLPTKIIEAEIRAAATKQNFRDRQDEKNFYFSSLARKLGGNGLRQTTEAIVLIRKHGAQSEALAKKLHASGFENIAIIP